MKLLVTKSHEGHGEFPLFKKGSFVGEYEGNPDYPKYSNEIWGSYTEPHWVACELDGHYTFIPDCYVTDGVLNKDYNPTELIVEKGKEVTLISIVFEWLYVKDEKGNEGWLPANKVMSAE